MTIFNNDEAIKFFRDNGYPVEYNDGLLAWLKDYFGVTTGALADLVGRYRREQGLNFQSAFNPTSLFAASEKGVWYDPSDFSTLFQDTAGTTPVTATGQLVARMNDKSGNGKHMTQATSAARPVIEQDANGKYYLNFDGIDDAMVSTETLFFSSTNNVSFFAGIRKMGDASIGVLFELGPSQATIGSFTMTAPSAALLNVSAGYRGLSAARTAAITNSSPSTSVLVVTANLATPRIRIRRNGGAFVETTNSTGGGNFADAIGYLGARAGNANLFVGRVYGVIFRGKTSTDAEITSAENYMIGKTQADA